MILITAFGSACNVGDHERKLMEATAEGVAEGVAEWPNYILMEILPQETIIIRYNTK